MIYSFFWGVSKIVHKRPHHPFLPPQRDPCQEGIGVVAIGVVGSVWIRLSARTAHQNGYDKRNQK